MKAPGLTLSVIFTTAILLCSLQPASAQQASGNAVRAVITVEARHGKEIPSLQSGDVMVYEGRDRDQVTDLLPLTGEHAALQLFVLIDDASNGALDPQLQDLRKFIRNQPASTSIGVGYMRDGTVQVVQNLTTDHEQAAKSIRLPFGQAGISPSPYFSLVDLIKKWPEAQVRRQVLMVSDGIDRFWGSGPGDPYVDSAIEATQKAGIVVYSIYAPGVGHYGHSFWRMNWGQNYLARLSDETGGENYNFGFSAAVSFSPYLEDLSQRLTHQYLVGFIPKPENKPGLRQVRFRTEVHNADLAGPDRVYVP